MSLHWYTCISTNTCCFEMNHISLETDWWALPNTSLIVWICLAIHEILADKAFIATDVLISQLFVVAFVHPTYMQIALIWSFPAQLSLWKSVHWLWRYKLNEVCDTEVSVLRHWQEQLHHGRLSWIEVSLLWKMKYLEDCSTTIRCVVRKMATVEGRLVWFEGGFTTGTLFPDRWTYIWHSPTIQQCLHCYFFLHIKRYIRLLKLLQTTLVFFVGKKDEMKRIVQDYWYLNK